MAPSQPVSRLNRVSRPRTAGCVGLVLAALLFSGQTGLAAELPSAASRSGRDLKQGDFMFSILPKSLQKNPALEMTVNTEISPYGRLLRPVSPEHPAYYVAQQAGYHQLGGPAGGDKVPVPAEMELAMTKALATNGFLPASPEHPASLVLIYSWGSHNHLPPGFGTPEMEAQNELERAILIGGKKFFDIMKFKLEWGLMPPGLDQEKYDDLQYQARKEIYYVVASAYDYQALARGERHVAWRTTMTVNSTGVALAETMRPLIENGAPFLGRETAEPEIGSRRMSREGHVEIGTATVVDEKAPAAGVDGKK